MKRFACLVSLTLALGCGDDGSSSPQDDDDSSTSSDTFPPVCTPGTPVACDCPDGSMGEAPCLGGAEVGACECPDTTTSSTTDPTTTSTTTSNTTTTATTDGTTGGTDDTTGTTGSVMPGCPNGVLEDGEQCDDGNMDDGDACSNTCIASCGLEWIEVDTTMGAATAAAVDSDGDYVVTSSLSDGTILVAKYAPDGTEEWANAFDIDGAGDSGAEIPRAIATFGNNSIFVAGEFGDPTPTAFIHHIDGSGVVAAGTWPNVAGGAVGSAIATDPNTGNAVLVGTSSANTAIRKVQPDGTTLWTIVPDFGGGNDDFGRGVAIDSAGNIWVGHDVDTMGDGNFIARLVRYPPEDTMGATPTPNIVAFGPLVTGAGIPASRTLRGVAVASDDSVAAAVATDPALPADSWDFWVARADDTGTLISLTNSDDQNVMGESRSVQGIALSSTDEISLSGTVDDGGASALVVRIGANGSTPICARATQDMALEAGFTVGAPGAAAAGTTVVPGGTATDGSPWLGRFRE